MATQKDGGGATCRESSAGDSGGSTGDKKTPHDAGPEDPGPLTDRAVAVTVVALAVMGVLGYWFVNKLSDISREEDCMLAHHRNCAGDSVPLER